MRLSDFHIMLAKGFAKGLKNKDLLEQYQISPSRLSVIKANPLFRREVERQRQLEDDKYAKALAVLELEAESLAREQVKLAKDPAVSADVRFKIIDKTLDRVAQKSGVSTTSTGGEEMIFEQMLRVTKRLGGIEQNGNELDFDPEVAYTELMDGEEVNVSSSIPSQSTQVEAEVVRSVPKPGNGGESKPDTDHVLDAIPVTPSNGGNGGAQKFTVSPRLRAILGTYKQENCDHHEGHEEA